MQINKLVVSEAKEILQKWADCLSKIGGVEQRIQEDIRAEMISHQDLQKYRMVENQKYK